MKNYFFHLSVTSESGDLYNFAFHKKIEDVDAFLVEALPHEHEDGECYISGWTWNFVEFEDEEPEE